MKGPLYGSDAFSDRIAHNCGCPVPCRSPLLYMAAFLGLLVQLLMDRFCMVHVSQVSSRYSAELPNIIIRESGGRVLQSTGCRAGLGFFAPIKGGGSRDGHSLLIMRGRATGGGGEAHSVRRSASPLASPREVKGVIEEGGVVSKVVQSNQGKASGRTSKVHSLSLLAVLLARSQAGCPGFCCCIAAPGCGCLDCLGAATPIPFEP